MSCFPQSRCNFLAFQTLVLQLLLLDLYTYGGVDPLGEFPLFLKKIADIIDPKLSIIFPELIRQELFLKRWRSTNVTAIPKGALSPAMEKYHPISITHILSKVYEKLVSHKLYSFCEKFVFFPAAQIAYRKGLGCTDALLTTCNHLQKSLDTGMESYIVKLNFCAVFSRVSHSGLLFKLKSIGVGGSVLSICREFLSNHRQRFVVDGAKVYISTGIPTRVVGTCFCGEAREADSNLPI